MTISLLPLASIFQWLFVCAMIWWLLWFVALPLGAGKHFASEARTKGKTKGRKNDCAAVLRRKALIVSLFAGVLTTLLQIFLL